MTLVRLVRHGRAAAGWDTALDPGLDEVGRAQAASVAERLDGSREVHDVHDVPDADGLPQIVSSPMRRCRETAAAFAARRGSEVRIADAVAEIPSPEGHAMADRVTWLRGAMEGEWSALGDRYTTYRDGVVAFVASLTVPTVVFSHFVAINAVIGRCLGDDRLVIRRLDNCSVTTVRVDLQDGAPVLRLVAGGDEADTLIR